MSTRSILRARRCGRAAALGVVVALALAGAAPAQEPAPEGEESAAAPEPARRGPEPPADDFDRGTPRSSVLGYLEACREGDYERAARHLHLGPVPAAERDTRGPELARELKQVLDQTLWVDVDALSDDPRGKREDGLPGGRDLVGRIETSERPVDVFVDRVPRGDGAFIWKISPVTIAKVPDLYAEFGTGVIAEYLPAPLVEVRLLELALWQWLALLVILLLAYFGALILAGALARVARALVRRSSSDLDDRLLELCLPAVRLLLTVAVFAAGTSAIGLPVPARRFLGGVEASLTIFAFTWLLFRVIDFAATVMDENMRLRGQYSATGFVPLGRRALKIALGVLATLAALDTFGFDVTALIAGLGVGGLAVALAAQKTLENVFGGVTVLTDQPVRVGDFCRFGDRVGTVEDIGIRSTRIRTLGRTVVTVPNADFSTMHLENFAKRDRILLETTLGLRYETTPDQLRWVLVELRKMLYAHPKVLHDPARVRFASFGDFSLNLEVWCYVRTSDWNEFLAVREDLYLRMMDIVAESGSGFAFPSQTAYLAKDDGVDAERTSAAEAQVAEWRRQSELMLPDFTAERIAAVDDSLDYPPEGSAAARRS